MNFILLNDVLQLPILAPDFDHVLGVESHLLEVNQDSPAPVLQFIVTTLTLYLHSYQSARLEEGNYVFGQCNYLVDLSVNFCFLRL